MSSRCAVARGMGLICSVGWMVFLNWHPHERQDPDCPSKMLFMWPLLFLTVTFNVTD